MGGLLKWLDLIDYCHYMTPMNALPPTPQLWAELGGDWRAEWTRRFETFEPWLLTWMEHQRSDGYWAQGTIRPDYGRIQCPTMIVAGWADGYRNNTFRTIEALAQAGVPHRLLAGPWGHMSASTSLPGPRIDLVHEMARWWDRHLRGLASDLDDEPTATWFVRESTRPEPDLDSHNGYWRTDDWPAESAEPQRFALDSRPPYAVVPDIGTAAWISCAGHLPYGQSLDQRFDDDASLTWDVTMVGPDGLEIAGHAPAPAPGHRVRAGRHRGGAAVRRVSRRHLGAGHPGHAQPHATRWFPAGNCPRAGGEPTTWRSSWRRRPTGGPRASECGSRWPEPTGPTPSHRRGRSRSRCSAESSCSPC